MHEALALERLPAGKNGLRKNFKEDDAENEVDWMAEHWELPYRYAGMQDPDNGTNDFAMRHFEHRIIALNGIIVTKSKSPEWVLEAVRTFFYPFIRMYCICYIAFQKPRL